ncbi:MAG: tripartite tricarboxylate transporter permease [Chloroflexota bacterium]
MDFLGQLFSNLVLGFSTVFAPINMMYCIIGVLVGTLVGVLPGIGPQATIAMLLPVTFNLPPVGAIIMLAGIYYGSQYGGSTTSILMNLPGEAASVITCLDGYQMAKQGRGGQALAIAAIGSFFAGTVGTILIALFGPPLAQIALSFGAAEYFSLMVMALILASVLGSGSLIKSLASIIMGLIFGIVGTDVNTGMSRFTFDASGLADGIAFGALAMGLFGLSDILMNLDEGQDSVSRDVLTKKITHLYPSWPDIKISTGPIIRGTAVGAVCGSLAGGGATIASFSSYVLEKRIAKNPEDFGKGAIQGVAGPEAANNAAAQCAFIPMLTLGIPSTATMAIILGALTILGIAPGPRVMTQYPDLFWGLVASMWIGNALLVVINLPLVGLWVKFLMVPYRFLFPAIVTFMAIGIYSLNRSFIDCYLTVFFGFLGYVFQKLKCDLAPLVLAFVLGPMIEENLRRALLFSRGDPTVFFTKPISAGLLIISALLLVFMFLSAVRKKRKVVLE